MQSDLREQKQAVVREAIYDAAIDLFARAGFDETTVEEVAHSAGVSRRTFFRYFDSKDDLLAYAVFNYAHVLTDAVTSCPRSYSTLQVLTKTALAAAQLTEASEARTRQVIKISERSASARQAYQSRMMDVEDRLAGALAAHFHDASPNDLRPRLLASITLTVMNAAIVAWFRGKYPDPTTAAQEVLKHLTLTFSENQPEAKTLTDNQLKHAKKSSRAKASKGHTARSR